MTRAALFGAAAVALILGLGACERHKSPAAQGAPEYLHEALAGDASAQAVLAACYATRGECLGVAADPALACAWRGVRLASRSPDLSLDDTASFRAACAIPDESERQRADVALHDLVRRIYGRGVGELSTAAMGAEEAHLLYPSLEAVRVRVNQGLAAAGAGARLPPLSAPQASADGRRLTWSSCARGVCLSGVTPGFGGGVVSYRITVAEGAGGARLALSLAGAGLAAPSAASLMQSAAGRPVAEGPVCWIGGRDGQGVAFAAASHSPCRLRAAS